MSSIDIVVPVYNEEECLWENVEKLREFLVHAMPFHDWQIVIADNGSTDRTPEITRQLSEQYHEVSFTRLEEKGRGRALTRTWLESQADIVAYMDVDLSSDLTNFLDLVNAIDAEEYDVAIGSRLLRGSQVKRSLRRELLSRVYNLIIRAMFRTRFHDAQCGFKALRKRAVRELVPLVKDKEWFFDTELLILAEKRGYRIKEIPIAWKEDKGTTVNIVRTALKDLKGLIRLKRSGL